MRTPLHGEWQELRLGARAFLTRRLLAVLVRFWLKKPQRARVSGMRDEGGRLIRLSLSVVVRAPRPDEKVGDVLEATLGFVAVEERMDFPEHVAACTPIAAHVAANQGEGDVVHR